jgi:hypothetical protein
MFAFVSIFRGGKFGAYGEPEIVKTMSDKTENGVRTLDIKWNTFTPGGSTLAKRSVVRTTYNTHTYTHNNKYTHTHIHM